MAQAYDPDLDCTDTAKLWPVEIETRTTNDYADRSARGDQYCFICTNFIEASQPDTCGTCRTVKGPIHPLGWCKSWTELVP